MKKVIFTLAFLIIVIGQAQADMFDMKDIPEKEILTYRFLYKGIDLARPNLKPFNTRYMAAEAAVGAEYVLQRVSDDQGEHLEVIVSVLSQNKYTIRHYFKFKPGPKMNVSYYEKTVLLPSGKKIRTEAYDLSESIPAFPNEIAHPLILPIFFRGLDFVSGKSRDFYLWLNPMLIMAMKVVVKGEEDVTVPAGTIRCYRLEMEPDMVDFGGDVIGRVLKPFVPKYTFWLDKKAPHSLVKYRGPFGQINSAVAPTETFELTKAKY